MKRGLTSNVHQYRAPGEELDRVYDISFFSKVLSQSDIAPLISISQFQQCVEIGTNFRFIDVFGHRIRPEFSVI